MQEIRCNVDDCTRLVAKFEAGVLSIRCPRCGEWRQIPLAALVAQMAVELAACQHTNGTENAPLMW